MRQHPLYSTARSLVSLPNGPHPKAAETLPSKLALSGSPTPSVPVTTRSDGQCDRIHTG